MFSRIISGLTGGGASVETTIDNPNVMPGGILTGTISIEGRDVADIRGLFVSLVTHCRMEVEGYEEKQWRSLDLIEEVELQVTSSTIRFQVEVPIFAPLSFGQTYTEFKTRLDVDWAIDPRDADRINITPDPIQNAVLQAMTTAEVAGGLGCTFKEAEAEYDSRNGFRQEVDYRPPAAYWSVEEIEISFLGNSGEAWIVGVTVDNRGGFFTSSQERTSRIAITRDDVRRGIPHIAGILRQAIASLTR